MPSVKVAGLPKEMLCDISEDLITLLSEATNTPRERITVFYDPTERIVAGEINNEKLYINIAWKVRTTKLKEKTSEAYFKYFDKLGYHQVRIMFENIDFEYVENGKEMGIVL